MIDQSIEHLLKEFIKHSAENGDLTKLTDQLSVGFVVDNDDPLQGGRIKIFCPAFNDDPKKLLHVPWAAYVSPFGGVVSQSSYTRGSIEDKATSDGPVHYGFWAPPEIGAHALVGCINGDPRRRFYLGCFPSHQETHTLGNGRFKHEDGKVDGPLTSTGNPIEPAYSKMQEAFNMETDTPEWKTRGADYQLTSVTEQPNRNKNDYVDDDYDTIQRNEIDDWVKEKLGEHGYDWTSYKNIASFLSPKTYTWTTPGFHSITLDDRPFNSRIRIRTSAGAQILMDDTNERMYISTSGGKGYLEMDYAGNVDLHVERRLSVHAEKDINLTAGESIRMKAGKFISMYAGDTRGQTPLGNPIPDGDIRIQASNDLHMKIENNLFANVDGNGNLDFAGQVNIGSDNEINIAALQDVNLAGADVTFTIAGKGTTIDLLTQFLDDFTNTFNSHAHVDAGANLNPQDAIDAPDPISVIVEETELAPWTNRVPQSEPWPRVMMQDSDDTVNEQNDGYQNNVDWIEQYDNIVRDNDPSGREPIGQIEGDEEIERGMFWRR